MAGADKLKERIIEEARRTAQANIEKAEREAAGMLDSARSEGSARKTGLLRKAEQEAQELKRRMSSAAELEGRKLKLRTKQELVDEAFNEAIEALNRLPLEKYTGILANMIVHSVITGDEALVLSQKDKDRLGAGFTEYVNASLKSMGKKGNISLAAESADISGGFILKRGNIEINNSFEAIIRMKHDELEAEVVKVLFSTLT